MTDDSPHGDPVPSDEHLKLEEQRDLAHRELSDLEDQVTAGEIDEATASRLRHLYETEAATAEAGLDSAASANRQDPGTGRSWRRAAAGTAIVGVAAGLIVFAVASAVAPRGEGDTVTGGIVDDVVSGEPIDLDSISNAEMEEVVAANPGLVPMRLALARRYVEVGDLSAALGHYMTILEQQTEPEALAYVGWISFLSNEPELGARYLEQSLEISPNFRLAEWFLANVRLFGLDDPSGAVLVLESLLSDADIPADIRAEAEAMLAEAILAGDAG